MHISVFQNKNTKVGLYVTKSRNFLAPTFHLLLLRIELIGRGEMTPKTKYRKKNKYF